MARNLTVWGLRLAARSSCRDRQFRRKAWACLALGKETPDSGLADRRFAQLDKKAQAQFPARAAKRSRAHTGRSHRWELFGRRAIRQGHGRPFSFQHLLGSSQLYDLAADPGETNDLAGTHAAWLDTLLAQRQRYFAETGVVNAVYPSPASTRPNSRFARITADHGTSEAVKKDAEASYTQLG